jgi:nucleotide sugar dehydrogenase
MEINVIGVGVTGYATAEVLRRLGHLVRIHDADLDRQGELEGLGYMPLVAGCGEVTFFCVPEWKLEDALESTLNGGLWVVRSTTRPGDTRAFQETHSRHIVHLPEFLRESTALADALTPDRIVVGECCQEHGNLVIDLFAPLMAPIVRTDSATSEMVKLVSNAHLSTLISFWNEVHQICERFQINSTVLGRAVSMDNRISPYGAVMHGKPFGGFCLPKDLNALINAAELVSCQPVLLESVRQVNRNLEANGATQIANGRMARI